MLLPLLRPPASETSDAAHATTRTTLWSSTSQHLEINGKFWNWLEPNWHQRCYHLAKLRSQTFSSNLFLFWRHAGWKLTWQHKSAWQRPPWKTSGNQEVGWGTPWNTWPKFEKPGWCIRTWKISLKSLKEIWRGTSHVTSRWSWFRLALTNGFCEECVSGRGP